MFATERSRQNLRLAGALVLAIAGRAYLSYGGAEAMVYHAAPQLRNIDEVRTFAGFAVLAVAASAAVAVAGKRWVGRLAAVFLAGVGGLIAISHYNAILGAVIGLAVGLLVACGVFVRVLAALAQIVVSLAVGTLCGAAALATQRDLSDGPGTIVLMLMAATVLATAFFLFRRGRQSTPVEWKRRWLGRLGRTSLLMLVIFGLWLSLSVDTVRRVNRLGFQCNLSPLVPERSWLWRGYLKVIDFEGRQDLTDDDMTDFRGFEDLQMLGLMKTRITDAGLAQLDALPRMSFLGLNETKITGEGFGHLVALPALRDLFLDDTQVNDHGLEQIGKLTALRSLRLGGTKVTDDGLKHLQGLTSLAALGLNDTQITGDGLQSLAPLNWLRTLDLGNTRITDADLEKLPALPRLTHMRLDGTRITDAGLQHLQKQPLLGVVEVRQTAVTDEGVERFRKAMQRRATMPRCDVQR